MGEVSLNEVEDIVTRVKSLSMKRKVVPRFTRPW